MPFAEDLSVFFSASEFASQARWGALTANVLLDSPTEDVLGGRALSEEYEATMPSTALPGVSRGELLTIAGGTYKVREVRLLDDGLLKRLKLTFVAAVTITAGLRFNVPANSQYLTMRTIGVA